MQARIESMDAVRGFAVLGILAMNIVSMGLPSFAYIDPSWAGGHTGADWWAWALAYLLADGKMRALFTLLFGASLLLVADRAAADGRGEAATHYRRMAWLLAFGMIHAWLLWYGDILVAYALAGSIAFLFRRLPPARLAVLGGVVIALLAAYSIAGWAWASHLQRVIADPATPAQALAAAKAQFDEMAGPPDWPAAEEIAAYRGGFASVFAARAEETRWFQTYLLPTWSLWEGIGWMAWGMALFKIGFWQGRLPDAAYRRAAWLAPLGVALSVPTLLMLDAGGWSQVTRFLDDGLRLFIAPMQAVGYAALVILWLRSGMARGLAARLTAAGRMALTNYLGATIIMTTLFYGYGLGLFGHLSRAQLYAPVAAYWALALWASPRWLARFRYGPAEWLWRSLARGAAQPMRGAAA